MTQNFERVRWFLSEQETFERPKRIHKHEPLEILPEQTVYNEKPDQMPHILLKQADNCKGLKNAMKYMNYKILILLCFFLSFLKIARRRKSNRTRNVHIHILTEQSRSHKLVFALCVVNDIISSKWIADSEEDGKFLRSDKCSLHWPDQFRNFYNKFDI